MSQSHQSADSQALLQSMLQRLKLQPGRDGQTHLQTPVFPPVGFAPGRDVLDGGRGVLNHHEVDNRPADVFGFNISPSNAVPAAGFTKQPGPGCEVGRSWTSFPSQRVNADGDPGGWRGVGRSAGSVEFSARGTGRLFPTESPKDVDLSCSGSTDRDGASVGFTNHVPPSMGAVSSMSQGRSLAPAWSHPGAAGEEALQVENGVVGGPKDSPDVQVFSGSQGTANIRKKRPSENKTRRWTQRIKERWKEKHGRKGKQDEGTADQIPTTNQVATAGNFINAPNNHGETTHPSLDGHSPSKTFPAQTENNTTDNSTRRNSEFEFGLGSFSLLEEITKGQEWARFINPNLQASSMNLRPPEEPQRQIPPNPFNTNQPAGSLNQLGDGSGPWGVRSTGSSQAPGFGTAPAPPIPTSVSMNVAEEKQPESVDREAEQLERMEDGQNQSDALRRESGPRLVPSSPVQPSDLLQNAVMKIRGQSSRKRHHQSAERGRSISAPTLPSAQMMEDAPTPQQGDVLPLGALEGPPESLSPFNPSAPVPRSIIKHSMSQDSETSVLTKRRRVEEKRKVHFAEEVVTIASPSVAMDLTDSEEDLRSDEDSLIEQEFEAMQAAAEEAIRARRSLPAWIKALKRKNTGKKHS
ncbi:uncharacterized protein LOC108243036 [Kryptolebias marmoratus]|uniref:uncharacterized protein LOC108243036 n=1 Tax=Kryptolebias marmoratus TaxID=37003 RepID=UPI0007F9414C|nr:uncharacterized protein LOC108243036 [Kryptolebias marmoratus]